jgi:hypothetical protein
MLYAIPALLIVSVLFAGIVLAYLLGLKVRLLRIKKDPTNEPSGIGPFEGALLGLLSLLLAFTFNQSASDFGRHLDLLVAESDAIEIALWRADLYPDSLRAAFRQDFRQYLAARIAYHNAGVEEENIRAARHDAEIITRRMWERAASDSRRPGESLRSSQMIPALNAMLDAESRREDARRRHVPDAILWLLLSLCLIGSFVVAYSGKRRKIDWVILSCYSLMTVLTVYFILDLDRPRRGVIATNTAHQNMLYLYKSVEENGR